ncbi:PadR family transcriptional regulator [Prauserella marina]|uniref:Virulence activator alpha C-term n=1 Tax=Prauserella marina TaxID=530584 RepID=A0A222VQR9_9PSEU|nr:PadR family transcriptional regulator [Prauserella marina]ASR36259.1 PadR family transcriptional regulator [Prauserella marina]PWV77030.1 PadR family transcriptional regulator [Prauserella marina]SDD02744.1 Virulence activator alpha C-term [Prauserella marina]
MPHDDTAAELPTLRPTSWAVLGLLSFGEELSGYDLKKWADWSLRFFYWAPSYSQIYGELRRLEHIGYAASRVVTKDDVRGKRLYAITPEGEQAVTRWANEAPLEPAVLKHGVMLRMWLGHAADPAHLKDMLTEHRAQSEKMRVRAEADAEGAESEPGWAYPHMVLKWAARYYQDERDRADSMLADLELLSAQRRRSAAKRRTSARRTSTELRSHKS